MRRIIVCKEKHGDRYWDAGNTREEQEAAARAIISERIKAGYWYVEGDLVEAKEALVPTPPDEEVAAAYVAQLTAEGVPEETAKKRAEVRVQATKNKAWRFLSNRAGEYESVLIAGLQEPTR